ncbi:MAG: UvrD-helicase domain-containing protein, partial [Candidatus Krumholzibacteria bacterium]|nr:UvrD-helicase domain-containing protein [Candidatus Krumholzibacteria bacterium]
RFLSIVMSGRARCGQIVAITFTEKAAGEMKVRLRKKITDLLRRDGLGPDERSRLGLARNELERAPISTIHSFAASILREHPLEADADPGFGQLDALENSLFIDECWNEFVSHLSAPHDLALKSFLSLGGSIKKVKEMALRLYDRRGDRFVEGVFDGKGRSGGERKRNTQVEAEIGMEGKGAEASPYDVEALNAFKDTISRGVEALSSLVESHCVNPDDRGRMEIGRFLEEVEVIGRLEGEKLEDFLLTIEMLRPRGNRGNWDPPEKCTEQKELAADLAEAQERYRKVFTDRLRDRLVGWLEGFVEFADGQKAEAGVLDFDDLLIKARELLGDSNTLRVLRRRYRYILVDEFQDTDSLQAEIILLLSGGAGLSDVDGPERGKLFIVGDPKQSIYRFRKADVEIYEEVRERLAESGSHLKITQNFRSVPGIIHWVNSVFSKIIRKPERGRFQPEYEPIHPHREGKGTSVVLLDLELGCESTKADDVRRREGETISRLIHRLVEDGFTVMDTESKEMRPVGYGDIAVIYRGTTGIEYYEDPLRSEKIPYIVEGGKLYYTRQEVRDLASALWAVEDPWDSLSLVATLRSPLFGFSDEEIFLFVRAGGRLSYLDSGIPRDDRFSDFGTAFDLLADLHEKREMRGPAGTLVELLRRTKYLELSLLRPHGDQRVLNIEKAIQNARSFRQKLHSYRSFA